MARRAIYRRPQGAEGLAGAILARKSSKERTGEAAETVSSWGQPEKANIPANLMMRYWLWQATGEQNSRNFTW